MRLLARPTRPDPIAPTAGATGDGYSRQSPAASGGSIAQRLMSFAMQMHYNGVVFRTVRESDWSAGHIAAHGVTLDEVREAILEHPYLAVPGRDGTTLIYGRTYAGRYLLVVALAEGEEAFIVTARDMTTAEKTTFRRKAR